MIPRDDSNNIMASTAGVPDRGPTVLAVVCAVQAASLVVVMLAGWTRVKLVQKPLALQGWTMLTAWLFSFAMSLAVIIATRHGLGRHDSDIAAQDREQIDVAIYAFSITYQLGLMAQKSAVLLLYLAVLSASRATRSFTLATLAVVDVGGLALTLLSVFRCSPVAAAWSDTASAQGSCISLLTIYLSSAPFNIVTDVAIILIPMPSLWSLRLPTRQKLALVLTFGFGLFAAAVDVIRIVYLEQASSSQVAHLNSRGGPDTSYSPLQPGSDDFSWSASISLMWSAVEINVGIMCGCVPALKPLLTRMFPRKRHHPPSFIFSPSQIVASPRLQNEDEGDGDDNGDDDNASSPPPPLPLPPGVFRPTPALAPLVKTPTSAMHLELPMSPATPSMPTSPHTPRSPFFALDRVASRRSDLRSLSQPFPLSRRQSTVASSKLPQIAIVSLFFWWGFEYGLLFILNQGYQTSNEFTAGQSTALHSLYYVGYVAGPPCLGYWLLRDGKFKETFLSGLAIFACGALIFWPASVLGLYPFYALSNLVLGFGLSNLEIAADSYMVLSGPPRYAAARLGFSQGIQGVGTVVATATFAGFSRSGTSLPLLEMQWLYLALAIFAALLAVAYYVVPLPTPSGLFDNDPSGTTTPVSAESAEGFMLSSRLSSSLSSRLITPHVLLFGGIIAMTCYVGGQEVNATSLNIYLSAMGQATHATFVDVTVAHAAFALSRFIVAGLSIWLAPSVLLAFFWAALVPVQVICMVGGLSDASMAALIVVILFLEGPIFPLIFAETMRFRGQRPVLTMVLLTSSIGLGGSVLSPISNAIQSAAAGRHAVQVSLAPAVAAFALGLLFPACLVWSRCSAARYRSQSSRRRAVPAASTIDLAMENGRRTSSQAMCLDNIGEIHQAPQPSQRHSKDDI